METKNTQKNENQKLGFIKSLHTQQWSYVYVLKTGFQRYRFRLAYASTSIYLQNWSRVTLGCLIAYLRSGNSLFVRFKEFIGLRRTLNWYCNHGPCLYYVFIEGRTSKFLRIFLKKRQKGCFLFVCFFFFMYTNVFLLVSVFVANGIRKLHLWKPGIIFSGFIFRRSFIFHRIGGLFIVHGDGWAPINRGFKSLTILLLTAPRRYVPCSQGAQVIL